MPYIVTTGYHADRAPDDPPDVSLWVEESRTAVATLDEARAVAAGVVADSTGNAGRQARHIAAIDALPESGGTIGPLPDGTVIAVHPTDWLELAGLVGWTLDRFTRPRLTGRTRKADRDAILAAYNEAQR